MLYSANHYNREAYLLLLCFVLLVWIPRMQKTGHTSGPVAWHCLVRLDHTYDSAIDIFPAAKEL